MPLEPPRRQSDDTKRTYAMREFHPQRCSHLQRRCHRCRPKEIGAEPWQQQETLPGAVWPQWHEGFQQEPMPLRASSTVPSPICPGINKLLSFDCLIGAHRLVLRHQCTRLCARASEKNWVSSPLLCTNLTGSPRIWPGISQAGVDTWQWSTQTGAGR